MVSLKIIKNVHFTFLFEINGEFSVFFVEFAHKPIEYFAAVNECHISLATMCVNDEDIYIWGYIWWEYILIMSTLISKEFIQNENTFFFFLTHTFGIWMRLPKSFTNTTLNCFALIDCLNYVLSWFLIKIDTDVRDTKHVSDIYNMHGYLVIQINNEYKGLKVLIISGALCLQQ